MEPQDSQQHKTPSPAQTLEKACDLDCVFSQAVTSQCPAIFMSTFVRLGVELAVIHSSVSLSEPSLEIISLFYVTNSGLSSRQAFH
jgi:hypothetical protein